jgi:hypothetical protein
MTAPGGGPPDPRFFAAAARGVTRARQAKGERKVKAAKTETTAAAAAPSSDLGATTAKSNGADTELPPKAKGFFDDLDSLRQAYAQPIEENAGIVAGIEPGKPPSGVFFRCDLRKEYEMPAVVLIDPSSGRGVPYLLTPALRDAYPDHSRPALLVPYVTAQDVVGVWVATLSYGGRGSRSWINSRLYAIEQSRQRWVKIFGDATGYRVVPAQGDLGEPKFPNLSPSEFYEIAWRDLIIDSDDHEVVQRVVYGVRK